jgi:hypothetical protein
MNCAQKVTQCACCQRCSLVLQIAEYYERLNAARIAKIGYGVDDKGRPEVGKSNSLCASVTARV